MDFEVGCTLTYDVEVLTPFVFNLEAARFPRQVIRSEQLMTTPVLDEPDRFVMPESGNRYARFLVPPGRLRVEYRAEVSVDPLIVDPTVVTEMAAGSIPLCRAVGIPARYISAYAWQLQPPDFHAVFEAYLAGPDGIGAWYLFDPTRMAALDGLVRIGAGRDAADVAFCSIYGTAKSEAPQVWINGPQPGPIRTVMAVSTQAP